EMYCERRDKMRVGEGDAKAVTAATHVIDPWPRYVGNRRIPVNGDRLSRAVERYRQGSYRQPAPPISPYLYGAGGFGGGGFGGGGVGGGGVGGAAAGGGGRRAGGGGVRAAVRAAARVAAGARAAVVRRHNEAKPDLRLGFDPKMMNAKTMGP